MASSDNSLQLYMQTCNLREFLRTNIVKLAVDAQFRRENLARTHSFLLRILELPFISVETRRRVEEFIATEEFIMRATEFDAQQHIGSLLLLIAHLEEVLAAQVNANKRH